MTKSFSLILSLFVFLFVGSVSAQYYSFDELGTSFPYQQGCSETLTVRAFTEGDSIGARGGRVHVLLDPQTISYDTGTDSAQLATTLFVPGTVFMNWSSALSPSWKPGSSQTVLQLDRTNALTNYIGNGGLYGTLNFIPRYSTNLSTGVFAFEYFPGLSTTETTLSAPGGVEIIRSAAQQLHLTGTYAFLQAPCVADTLVPTVTVFKPLSALSHQVSASGILLDLSDNGGDVSSVPYVWTGGSVGIGLWTGNQRNVDPALGIDISSLHMVLSGNGQTRVFDGASYAAAYGKTWQYADKNYSVSVPSSALFDYGIEKKIDLTTTVRDRAGQVATHSFSFNLPQGPTEIAGMRSPISQASFVLLNAPIKIGVKDDWAGVDTGSLVFMLQGTAGTSYGPYQFSGTDLVFSGMSGQANTPDVVVSLLNHPQFPFSGTIRLQVAVRDMQGNAGTISDSIFTTRPSCSDLQCCSDTVVQTRWGTGYFLEQTLFMTGGNNPKFTKNASGVGLLSCGTEQAGLAIFRGEEAVSGSTQVSFFEGPLLSVWGSNVKAVFSGSTLYLQRIFEYGYLGNVGGGSHGGGGSHLVKDICPTGDNSPSYYDHSCDYPGNGPEHAHGSSLSCAVKTSPYSDELTSAFEYAYGAGITTMCPIEKADMTGFILRKHLAKMISEYAVKTLGVYPDLYKQHCDEYADMSLVSEEMNYYAKISCQLGLMGLKADGVTPDTTFEPDVYVTRAQFGTIISRLIFGDVYNIKSGNLPYYKKHLDALKQFGVMTKIDEPKMQELRGYVLLMFQRTYEQGLVDEYRLATTAKNGKQALLSEK